MNQKLLFTLSFLLVILSILLTAPYFQVESKSPECKLQPGKEYPPENEEKLNSETLAILAASLKEKTKPGEKMRRAAHPKAHGCVRAIFKVLDTIPSKYKYGVFNLTQKSFPTWIRYSNGNTNVQSDTENDARGMAVKVMNVPGKKILEDEIDAPTQDFIASNCPHFFIKDMGDYVGFTKAATKGFAAIVQWFLLNFKFKELGLVRKFLGAEIGNPLLSQFWSVTPYRFGGEDSAIKFTFKPVNCTTRQPLKDIPKGTTENYLRERMKATLANVDACYDFLIQEQGSDACKNNIEDSRDEWTGNWVKLAELTVMKQEFDRNDKELAFCEHLSFTPWHSLPVHRPLGSINRCRRVVYQGISIMRHKENKAERKEPNSWEIPN